MFQLWKQQRQHNELEKRKINHSFHISLFYFSLSLCSGLSCLLKDLCHFFSSCVFLLPLKSGGGGFATRKIYIKWNYCFTVATPQVSKVMTRHFLILFLLSDCSIIRGEYFFLLSRELKIFMKCVCTYVHHICWYFRQASKLFLRIYSLSFIHTFFMLLANGRWISPKRNSPKILPKYAWQLKTLIFHHSKIWRPGEIHQPPSNHVTNSIINDRQATTTDSIWNLLK